MLAIKSLSVDYMNMSEFVGDMPGEGEQVEHDQQFWAEVYEYLGAQKFADQFREPSTGPLDIEATSEKLGIPVTYEAIHGHARILGLDGEVPIEVEVLEDDYEKAMSFSHELGHYLLYLTGNHSPDLDNNEETFCEYFGRKFSMPTVDLLNANPLDGDNLLRICEEYQVSLRSLLIWMMESEKLPPLITIDTRFPVTPNPDYSRVVSRSCVCLGCEYGNCDIKREEFVVDESQVFDLTAWELGIMLPTGHGPRIFAGDPEFIRLQEKYV